MLGGGAIPGNDRAWRGFRRQPNGWQRAIRIWAARTFCLFPSSGLMAPKEVLTGNGEQGRGRCSFHFYPALGHTELAWVPQPLGAPRGPGYFSEPLAAGQGPQASAQALDAQGPPPHSLEPASTQAACTLRSGGLTLQNCLKHQFRELVSLTLERTVLPPRKVTRNWPWWIWCFW